MKPNTKGYSIDMGCSPSTSFPIPYIEIITNKNATTMAFWNPHVTTQIINDGSPVGLGTIFTQQQQNGEYRPVAYGSRSLTGYCMKIYEAKHKNKN